MVYVVFEGVRQARKKAVGNPQVTQGLRGGSGMTCPWEGTQGAPKPQNSPSRLPEAPRAIPATPKSSQPTPSGLQPGDLPVTAGVTDNFRINFRTRQVVAPARTFRGGVP